MDSRLMRYGVILLGCFLIFSMIPMTSIWMGDIGGTVYAADGGDGGDDGEQKPPDPDDPPDPKPDCAPCGPQPGPCCTDGQRCCKKTTQGGYSSSTSTKYWCADLRPCCGSSSTGSCNSSGGCSSIMWGSAEDPTDWVECYTAKEVVGTGAGQVSCNGPRACTSCSTHPSGATCRTTYACKVARFSMTYLCKRSSAGAKDMVNTCESSACKSGS